MLLWFCRMPKVLFMVGFVCAVIKIVFSVSCGLILSSMLCVCVCIHINEANKMNILLYLCTAHIKRTNKKSFSIISTTKCIFFLLKNVFIVAFYCYVCLFVELQFSSILSIQIEREKVSFMCIKKINWQCIGKLSLLSFVRMLKKAKQMKLLSIFSQIFLSGTHFYFRSKHEYKDKIVMS